MNETVFSMTVGRLREIFVFLKQGIWAAKTTGTVAPSTLAFAKFIVNLADLRNAKTVVEFGPGTGVITEVILSQLSPHAKFFAIEINSEFVYTLREKFPNLIVFEDSAQNIMCHLRQHGVDGCDCIISGLPWALFNENLQTEILDAAYEALVPGGRFLTFTYFFSIWTKRGKRFRKLLHQRFGESVTLSRIMWKNLPPARVYVAIKKI